MVDLVVLFLVDLGARLHLVVQLREHLDTVEVLTQNLLHLVGEMLVALEQILDLLVVEVLKVLVDLLMEELLHHIQTLPEL
jgi:hypothetical protein